MEIKWGTWWHWTYIFCLKAKISMIAIGSHRKNKKHCIGLPSSDKGSVQIFHRYLGNRESWVFWTTWRFELSAWGNCTLFTHFWVDCFWTHGSNACTFGRSNNIAICRFIYCLALEVQNPHNLYWKILHIFCLWIHFELESQSSLPLCIVHTKSLQRCD